MRNLARYQSIDLYPLPSAVDHPDSMGNGQQETDLEMGLRGGRALVTGAAGGIGGAVCRMLASEGCAVMVHDLAAKADTGARLVEEQAIQ